MTSAKTGVVAFVARRRAGPDRQPLHLLIWAAIAALVVLPLLPLFYASVRSRPIYDRGGSYTTLYGYRSLLSDPAFWNAVTNTLEFAVTVTVLGVLAGAGLAVLCERTDLPGASLVAPLAMVPLLLPPLGLILGWNALYGDGGWLTSFITGSLHLPWDIGRPWGMGIVGASVSAPVALLIVRAALRNTDSLLEDAARGAGAATPRILARITLPLLRPALVSAALLIFTISLEQLGMPIFLGAQHNVQFVASYLYSTWANSATPDPPSISAGAVLLLVVATGLVLARRQLLGSEERLMSKPGKATSVPLPLGRWRLPLLLVVVTFLLVTIVLPVGGLMLSSVVSLLTPLISPFSLLTLDNFRTVLSDPVLSSSITNSLTVAGVGALSVTGLIAVATLVAHRSSFVLRQSLRFLMLYPRSMPGVIISLAFFWAYLFFVPPGAWIRNNLIGEGVALAVRAFPLAYLVIYPSLTSLPSNLDDAARSAGASWWTTSRRILLPLLRPALLAAATIVFVSMLNDYEAAIFLAKPNTELMGVEMLQQYAKGTGGPVAALAVLQLAISAGVICLAAVLFKCFNRSRVTV